MQSPNRVIVAAAGSGKTTTIINEVLSKPQTKIAVITYTINNEEGIRRKFYEIHGCVPENVSIYTWYTFLLRECARPYQNFVYEGNRVESIAFVTGRSAPYVKKADVKGYFFSHGRDIYTDKISEFACECNSRSNGLMIQRLSEIYDQICIDEVQDLAGHDLDLVELFLRSPMEILLVGDNRQATYSTNNSARYSQFKGDKIVDLFRIWQKKGLCQIQYQSRSHRCNQAICDFADRLYPTMDRTKSENQQLTGHDGVFLVPAELFEQYISLFSPVILRYDKRTLCDGHDAINFGESKGLEFDRVLILPNGPINRYLSSGDLKNVEDSCEKFYVAITRAKHSVAFMYTGKCNVPGVSSFEFNPRFPR